MKSPFVLEMVYNYIYMAMIPLPVTPHKTELSALEFSGGSGGHIGPNCRRRASTSCGIDDVNHRYLTIDGVNHRC